MFKRTTRIGRRSRLTVFLAMSLLAPEVLGTRILNLSTCQQPMQRDANTDADQEIIRLRGTLRDGKLRQNDPERLTNAIIRLGELRAVAAIDDLVDLVAFKRSFRWEKRNDLGIVEIQPITPANRYPAAGALIQIGNPALPALVRALEEHDSGSQESQNVLFVVQNLFRDQPMEAVTYLRESASKSQTPLASSRLLAAANRVSPQPRR